MCTSYHCLHDSTSQFIYFQSFVEHLWFSIIAVVFLTLFTRIYIVSAFVLWPSTSYWLKQITTPKMSPWWWSVAEEGVFQQTLPGRGDGSPVCQELFDDHSGLASHSNSLLLMYSKGHRLSRLAGTKQLQASCSTHPEDETQRKMICQQRFLYEGLFYHQTPPTAPLNLIWSTC